jgi:hypothetical protein
MSEQANGQTNETTKPRDIDYAQAQLAYSIIESLLQHTTVLSDLIALMARTMDEDTTKALTNTPQWTAYLDSRRMMERTKKNVEKFSEEMNELLKKESE